MEKPMQTNVLAATALMALGVASFAPAKEAQGEKPVATPGWIVIEEDVWTPLRFEPIETLDAIQYHFRRNEEKAAANEIDKAVSWLRLAAGHALPITQDKLHVAANDLSVVAKDLRAGNIAAAADMDSALARASQALGEWHYYKATQSWGENEEEDAGRDLAMAANYLQHAANSAHYEFGADTTKVITDYYRHGSWDGESVAYDHNKLGKDLQSIEKAVKELATKMKNA
jgi:hypothetical protein